MLPFIHKLAEKSPDTAPSEWATKKTSSVHDFTAGTSNFAYADALKEMRLGSGFGWWLIPMII